MVDYVPFVDSRNYYAFRLNQCVINLSSVCIYVIAEFMHVVVRLKKTRCGTLYM